MEFYWQLLVLHHPLEKYWQPAARRTTALPANTPPIPGNHPLYIREKPWNNVSSVFKYPLVELCAPVNTAS